MLLKYMNDQGIKGSKDSYFSVLDFFIHRTCTKAIYDLASTCFRSMRKSFHDKLVPFFKLKVITA